MNIAVFLLFLFGLQAVCLWVGGKSSRNLKTQNDYFLAGRKIPFLPLMMTFLATQIGGGLILGSAEEAYHYGWSVLFYPLGAALGLILLGIGMGRRLAQFQVSTIAQIFEAAYRSPLLKKIASILSIVSLFMVLVAQIIASNKFMVSLGVESSFWFVAFWGIVILYTALGGLKAVISTDIIQAAFFVIIFALSFGFAAFSPDIPFWHTLQGQTHQFALNHSKLIGWLLMPLLFMVIEQDMGQRCFAGKSPKIVSKATLTAAAATFAVSMIPVFFGVFAKGAGMEIASGGSVFMTVIQQTTNPIITALVSCAILCAIISTADSLINAIGSNLAQDFKFSKKIHLSQLLSAGIAVAGIFFSFCFNNIVDLLIQSYELSVSCLFVPIFIALFKKQGNALSASLAMAFGAIGFVLFRIFPTDLPKEVLSILLSLAGFYFGELILTMRSKASSQSLLNQ